MNAPPSRLFTQENAINAGSPGTLATSRTVPRRSSPPRSSTVTATAGPAGAGTAGIRTRARCSSDATSTTSAATSTVRIPSTATSSPDATEVTRKDTPVAVPTSPLARSRTGAGTSRVTSVGSAMVRRFPAITPSISATTSVHSSGLVGSRKASAGASRSSARHSA